MKFNPPIPERSDDELIAIALNPNLYWSDDASEQAKAELKKRGVNEEYQQMLMKKWQEEDAEDMKRFEMERIRELEENAKESYSIAAMIYIFIGAPFVIIGRAKGGMTIWELKRENYQIKLRQRLLLLLGGIATWILILYLAVPFNC